MVVGGAGDLASVQAQALQVQALQLHGGLGLLQGEVAFLTATLIVIDMTLAGLFWAMGHATGQGEDVIAKLIRKVLYVGAFAYIIGNFNMLASVVFRSFAGLGLTASGSTLSMGNFLQPGRLAKAGIDAAAPILDQIKELSGFPEVFIHLAPIVVLFFAWLVVIVSFFVLAVQLFVTLIEFKLTTLAGFVLVPFALWNKTAFLAEKVLGNVVSSGIKVLVLAVIVGIGSGLFSEFNIPAGSEPSIDRALVIMLASLSLLALGIFGPGIATGLVSGGPQLGAGAMVQVVRRAVHDQHPDPRRRGHQGLLVVVLRRLARTLHEVLLGAGHDHERPVVGAVRRERDRGAAGGQTPACARPGRCASGRPRWSCWRCRRRRHEKR